VGIHFLIRASTLDAARASSPLRICQSVQHLAWVVLGLAGPVRNHIDNG